MISEETEERLRQLLAEQPTYKPAPKVLQQVADAHVICFVGATCMGKTTVMQQLITQDSRFGEFIVFTSREPRPGDNKERYTYYGHSDAGLAPLLERIENHEVLQYNINPFSLLIYGSEGDGYPYDYNVGDVFASSIDGFRQLGYGSVQVLSIATVPEHWLERFDARFPLGDKGRDARRLEAIHSLEWSLAQTNPDHAWVINRDHELDNAVSMAKRAIDGRATHQAEARELAEACLRTIKGLSA